MIRLYIPIFATGKKEAYFRYVDREMAGFDSTTFWNGERFDGKIPSEVRILMSDGKQPDYTHLPTSWDVFSDRAATRIAKRAGDAVQFFDAPLYHQTTGQRIEGYKVLNATRKSHCLDLSKSKIRYDSRDGTIDTVFHYVFDEALIPKELHVFRAAEQPVVMFFSRQLKDDLMSGNVLEDLAFLEYGGAEVVEIRRSQATYGKNIHLHDGQ